MMTWVYLGFARYKSLDLVRHGSPQVARDRRIPPLSRVNEMNRGTLRQSMIKTIDTKPEQTEKDWFFYIVRCCDDSLYAGITDDIDKRLKAHNRCKGAKYTASHRPVSLVYFEKRIDISDARKREAQVKSWPKDKKEELIQGIIQ